MRALAYLTLVLLFLAVLTDVFDAETVAFFLLVLGFVAACVLVAQLKRKGRI